MELLVKSKLSLIPAKGLEEAAKKIVEAVSLRHKGYV
jgi:hypothetical protein